MSISLKNVHYILSLIFLQYKFIDLCYLICIIKTDPNLFLWRSYINMIRKSKKRHKVIDLGLY